MVAALASLYTERRLRSDMAMTGEITLSGLVLPIGGLKEKVLAARRGGIKKVILPKHNLSDLDELQPEVRQDLEFFPIETIDDAFRLVFADEISEDAALVGKSRRQAKPSPPLPKLKTTKNRQVKKVAKGQG
jgi:ATP-dependent Lon protease